MFRKIFPDPKPIIGMIALPSLESNQEFVNSAIERALNDLETLQHGCVDGVCIENDYDQPHRLTVASEMVDVIARIADEVVQHAKIPVGVQVLLNDWRASLTIAKQTGCQFVRLDFFVDKVRIAAGMINPEPDAIIDYRKKISAEHVALFTDIQVKHSDLLEPGKSLTVSTHQAIAHGSNALVVSGTITGESPVVKDLQEVRSAADDFPVLIGSGATPENVSDLLHFADGAIVGTSLKNSKASHEPIVLERVEKLMDAARTVRIRTHAGGS
jgi:membrane complex biogenesis BtpA family protein